MIEVNPAQFKTKPFAHQLIDVKALCTHSAYALFNEMGCGKTKTVVDAACTLASAGKIDMVIVVCPASVRSVWSDKEIGEIKKHAWVPTWVSEYANGKQRLKWDSVEKLDHIEAPHFIITNYEILRGAKHLEKLIEQIGNRKTLLVLDESSYIKSHTAKQTKAVRKLRSHCARCIILNGTPVTNNPLDLWSQMQVLSPEILEHRFKNFWFFRSEFCEMVPQKFGSVRFNKIVGYRRLDKLQKLIAPYCVRRLKTDCLDLPPKIYTIREVALSNESWARYKMLKNEAVVALEGRDELHLEPNAAVRIMRLAQLTSGHYNSLEMSEYAINEPVSGNREIPRAIGTETKTHDISSEKIDWCLKYLTEETTARYIIVWCRWRRERERLHEALKAVNCHSFQIYGGQKKSEREIAIDAFSENRPIDAGNLCVLLAQPHAAGFGLNLQVATEAIYLSNDFSYGIRLQSEDRCHRPGQEHPVTYIDVLATSPTGGHTIDHIIAKALREKANLAEFSTAMWRKALEQE